MPPSVSDYGDAEPVADGAGVAADEGDEGDGVAATVGEVVGRGDLSACGVGDADADARLVGAVVAGAAVKLSNTGTNSARTTRRSPTRPRAIAAGRARSTDGSRAG